MNLIGFTACNVCSAREPSPDPLTDGRASLIARADFVQKYIPHECPLLESILDKGTSADAMAYINMHFAEQHPHINWQTILIVRIGSGELCSMVIDDLDRAVPKMVFFAMHYKRAQVLRVALDKLGNGTLPKDIKSGVEYPLRTWADCPQDLRDRLCEI